MTFSVILTTAKAVVVCVSLLLLMCWIRVQGRERIPAGQFTETDGYFYLCLRIRSPSRACFWLSLWYQHLVDTKNLTLHFWRSSRSSSFLMLLMAVLPADATRPQRQKLYSIPSSIGLLKTLFGSTSQSLR